MQSRIGTTWKASSADSLVSYQSFDMWRDMIGQTRVVLQTSRSGVGCERGPVGLLRSLKKPCGQWSRGEAHGCRLVSGVCPYRVRSTGRRRIS